MSLRELRVAGSDSASLDNSVATPPPPEQEPAGAALNKGDDGVRPIPGLQMTFLYIRYDGFFRGVLPF